MHVGRIPEGVAFASHGDQTYVLVQCHPDRKIWVLKLTDTGVADTGQRIAVPGMPSSLRASPRVCPVYQLLNAGKGTVYMSTQRFSKDASATRLTRRETLRSLGLGAAGAWSTMAIVQQAIGQESSDAEKPPTAGAGKVTIRKVRAITTAPQRSRLVVVKVETSEPELYGLGCATFNQRPLSVVEAVDKYLDPFAQGRDVDNIEDLWQNAYTSSYWRNGPVLNNALSGLDMALWDIKGKRAGMPVYQLLGGKSRFAVDCYAHASGRDAQELADSVRGHMEQGFRHIRIQLGAYGSPHLSSRRTFAMPASAKTSTATWIPYPTCKPLPRRSNTFARWSATRSNCYTMCTNGFVQSRQ